VPNATKPTSFWINNQGDYNISLCTKSLNLTLEHQIQGYPPADARDP
jgi:hypothetical protein